MRLWNWLPVDRLLCNRPPKVPLTRQLNRSLSWMLPLSINSSLSSKPISRCFHEHTNPSSSPQQELALRSATGFKGEVTVMDRQREMASA